MFCRKKTYLLRQNHHQLNNLIIIKTQNHFLLFTLNFYYCKIRCIISRSFYQFIGVSMLKKNMFILTLMMCGLLSTQAIEISSFSQSIDSQKQLACCGKRKPKRKHHLAATPILASCPKCKDKRIA